LVRERDEALNDDGLEFRVLHTLMFFFHSLPIYSGKVFKLANRLNIHIRQVHQSDASDAYRCNMCFKGFTYKKAALMCEKIHSSERKIACDHCEKIFYTVSQKVTHQLVAHPKYRRCDHCDFIGKSLEQLQNHMKENHYLINQFY
jgi:hypothetical protein